MTNITKHFTLEELCASATAKARGIQNKPSAQQIIALVYLTCYVLEPLREAMNEPIPISYEDLAEIQKQLPAIREKLSGTWEKDQFRREFLCGFHHPYK